MHYILFDSSARLDFLPFTHTRAVARLYCGITTMQEKWNYYLQASTHVLTTAVLQDLHEKHTLAGDNFYINSAYFPCNQLATAITSLNVHQCLVDADGTVIAYHTAGAMQSLEDLDAHIADAVRIPFTDNAVALKHVWDIFSKNDWAIRNEYAVLTNERTSAPIPEYVTVVGDKSQLFVEAGAVLMPCIINVATGPVYIAKNAEIMEGAVVRGPLAMGEGAVLKMAAKVYGATTIAAGSKAGGEVNNVVFFENSNKGHDGFLGNAVIGEWCNLGADTNCSNLKNNYDEVKIWSEKQKQMIPTGLQFCGLLMGDHSKCSINSMFNTGTVVGVSCNIFGTGFPDKFVPSFTWGGIDEVDIYQFEKAVETANRMMERRHKSLTPAELSVLKHVFTSQHSVNY